MNREDQWIMPRANFDSAARDPRLERYSFVAADPFAWIERPADGSDALGYRLADAAEALG